jgi:predicted transcriptional regulator
VEQKCVNEKIVTVRSKREQTDVASEKAAKMVKISDSWTPQHSGHRLEKENVDPRYSGNDADLGANLNKAGSLHKNTLQVSVKFHM